MEFIETLDAKEGGEFPEAVHDGLFQAVSSINWRKSLDKPTLRYIFHIADAPPHGEEYCVDKTYRYSWKDGCPCGIKIEKIAKLLNMQEIHYRLIKCREKYLEKMG